VCDIDGTLVRAVVHSKNIASCVSPAHAVGSAALHFGNHGVVQPGSVSVRLTFFGAPIAFWAGYSLHAPQV